MRFGFGVDAHAFEKGKALVIGGATIPFDEGLAGHSDGDVLCHAIADALLGAAGLGDLGTRWPPSEETRGASSLEFLTTVADLLERADHAIVNIDATVVAEAPRLSTHRQEMIMRVADALRIDVATVSVKSTTTDGLGFTGRGEGIAAFAVASISRVGE